MGIVVTKRDNSEAPSFLGVNSILNDISQNKQRRFNNDYNLATTFDDPDAIQRLKVGGIGDEKVAEYFTMFKGKPTEDSPSGQIPNVLQKAGEFNKPIQLNPNQRENIKNMTETAIFSNTPTAAVQFKTPEGETAFRNLKIEELSPETEKRIKALDAGQKQFMALSDNFERVFGRRGTAQEVLQAQSDGKIYANLNNPQNIEAGRAAVNNSADRTQQMLNGGKPDSIYDPKTIQDPSDAQRMALAKGMTGNTNQQVTNEQGNTVPKYNTQSPNFMSNFLQDYARANKREKLMMAMAAMQSGNMSPEMAAGIDAITNSNVQGQFKAPNSLPLQQAASNISVKEDAQKKENWVNSQNEINSRNASVSLKGVSTGGGNRTAAGPTGGRDDGMTNKQALDFQFKKDEQMQQLKDKFYSKNQKGKITGIQGNNVYAYNEWAQKYGGTPEIYEEGAAKTMQTSWDSPEYQYFIKNGPLPKGWNKPGTKANKLVIGESNDPWQ